MKETTINKNKLRKRAKYIGTHPYLKGTEGYVKPNKSSMYLYLPDKDEEWYRVNKYNLTFITW